MKFIAILFLVLAALVIFAPAQVKEFAVDRAVIRESEQIPDSVIEWADLHQVWEITIDYGLEVQGRGITKIQFDGNGNTIVSYQEKR